MFCCNSSPDIKVIPNIDSDGICDESTLRMEPTLNIESASKTAQIYVE